MTRMRPPDRRPARRRLKVCLSMAGGLLFVSAVLETIFAQSVVMLTAFVVWLLIVGLVGHLLGLWN